MKYNEILINEAFQEKNYEKNLENAKSRTLLSNFISLKDELVDKDKKEFNSYYN